MAYDKKRVAHRLKSLRMDKGWDQEMLAKKSNISISTISSIEIARNGMSLDTACKLADALGCSLECLVCRE